MPQTIIFHMYLGFRFSMSIFMIPILTDFVFHDLLKEKKILLKRLLILSLPYITENTRFSSFWDWLISLRIMVSSLDHLIANGIMPFFLMAE